MPSANVVFATPSIKWGWSANATGDTLWRTSLAWLDYNLLQTCSMNPQITVIGSFDDVTKRNGWLIADTRQSLPQYQMRNAAGAIQSDAYYQRVTQWTQGNPAVVPGGPLPDGCYRIVNEQSGYTLQRAMNTGSIYSTLIQGNSGDSLNTYFWLYHLGNSVYKIISLNNGAALQAHDTLDGSSLEVSWNDSLPEQFWKIASANPKASAGNFPYGFVISNISTGMVMDLHEQTEGAVVVQNRSAQAISQAWYFLPVATIAAQSPTNIANPVREQPSLEAQASVLARNENRVLSLHLDKPSTVTISVFASNGTFLWSRTQTTIPAGNSQILLLPEAQSGNRSARGIRLCVVTIGTHTYPLHYFAN